MWFCLHVGFLLEVCFSLFSIFILPPLCSLHNQIQTDFREARKFAENIFPFDDSYSFSSIAEHQSKTRTLCQGLEWLIISSVTSIRCMMYFGLWSYWLFNQQMSFPADKCSREVRLYFLFPGQRSSCYGFPPRFSGFPDALQIWVIQDRSGQSVRR